MFSGRLDRYRLFAGQAGLSPPDLAGVPALSPSPGA